MDNILLSVIVVTYNQEDYIGITLESIANQCTNFPCEILVGDDCSSDKTKDVINEYEKKYPGLIKGVFNNPNMGVVKNYYNLIKMARGKYIMECGGDDYWLPGKVQHQLAFMENNSNIGLLYSTAKKWDEKNNVFMKDLFGSRKTKWQDLVINNDIPAPSVCFRRNLILQYINEVDPEKKEWIMEDYPAWLWFALKSKFVFEPESMCVYRVIENSISHDKALNKKIAFTKSTFNMFRFFNQKYNLNLKNLDSRENLILATYCYHNGENKQGKEYVKLVKNPLSFKDKLKLVVLKSPILRKIFF